MIARPLNTSVQDVAHAERSTDRTCIDLAAVEAQCGSTCNDEQLTQSRQRLHNVVDDAVGKVGLVARRNLPEWQNRN